MKKFNLIFVLSCFLFCCSPKGPQTFPSSFVGKSKSELIAAKGQAQKIKHFDNAEAIIYVKREEYFGNVSGDDFPKEPKKVFEIEYIYYVNSDNVVYKYQVWRKRIDK